MSIFPLVNEIQSDFGPEFSKIWTGVCVKYGVNHVNEIPKRSQNNGSAEISIKLLKQGLARICAGKVEGRKNWPDALPKLIQTLNSYFPYRSKLYYLLFSPFYNCATRLDVKKIP